MIENSLSMSAAMAASRTAAQASASTAASSSVAGGVFAAMLTKAQGELEQDTKAGGETAQTNSGHGDSKVDTAALLSMMMPGFHAADPSSAAGGLGGANSEMMMYLLMFLMMNQDEKKSTSDETSGLSALASGISRMPGLAASGEKVSVNGKTYEYPSFAGDVGKVVKNALTRLGDPYSREKAGSGDYTDCSYLSRWCYRALGVEIPRTAAEQARHCVQNGMTVSKEELKPGDLIFFSLDKNGRYKDITHVGIYAGNGMMVDASAHYGEVVYRKVFDSGVVLYGRPK